MSIRDQIKADVASVLIDPEVFAQPLNWNGQDILAVQDVLPETGWSGERGQVEGVNLERMRWIVAAGVLDPVPVAWEEVTINGAVWYVMEVRERLGSVEIDVSRNAS